MGARSLDFGINKVTMTKMMEVMIPMRILASNQIGKSKGIEVFKEIERTRTGTKMVKVQV